MKVIALVMIAGVLLAGCVSYESNIGQRDGNDPGDACRDEATTKCELATCVMMDGLDDACVGWEGCCLCDCWLDSRQTFDAELLFEKGMCECTPLPDPNPLSCRGEDLYVAEQCLRDESTCQEPMVQAVDDVCQLED